ncbi:hypothetical protein [Streptomyces aureus]|uniref:Transposase n=1 Tax=Streptomyces aureus TaxID=193461 RepID=A0ABV4SWF4_9ACTN
MHDALESVIDTAGILDDAVQQILREGGLGQVLRGPALLGQRC